MHRFSLYDLSVCVLLFWIELDLEECPILFVIQVKWVSDNLDGYLNFYSISGDGRVTNWTIVKVVVNKK